MARLGIAITTYNRRAMLMAMLDALRERTSQPYDLVVCDDGSGDGTRDELRARGVAVLGGVNRGIAWNKNRGLFYLREIVASDVILLLDDDVMPTESGWEQLWIAAVRRHGHMNYMPTGDMLDSGANVPENPGVSEKLWGQCIAFSRPALSYVGYMDTRFTGYGHEHTELTLRAIRAGFGGHARIEAGRPRRFFYSIEGGIRVLPNTSYTDPVSIARNGRILDSSDNEPIYRHAWRSDEEYKTLREELSPLDGVAGMVTAGPDRAASAPPAGNNLARGRLATQSSRSVKSRGATPEEDAAGAVSGTPTGGRNFQTEVEEEPWWQVDLGEARPIAEVRVYNTLEETLRDRFGQFVISIAFDPDDWIEVCRKDDDLRVGGADGEPFIWRPALSAFARFVRVTLLGTGCLHLDQVEVFGPGRIDPVKVLSAADAEPADAALFSRFISLGDNCEFGMVQRRAGVEPLDLLRFGGTGNDEAGLILAMEERFAAFGLIDDMGMDVNGDEWIATSRRYGVTFHTQRYTHTHNREQMVFEMSKRLRLLADKLVEDLETSGKIFVRKSNKPVAAETMFDLRRAMAQYGGPTLLWVVEDAAAHATVTELAPGFLRGNIRRLAPYEDATDVRVSDWRELCRAVVTAAGLPEPAVPTVFASDALRPESDHAAALSGQAANLARGQPATQSSVSEWSRGAGPAEDAVGAVDGAPDGTAKFHTGMEEGPWWQVDLGAARTIAAVRIYNVVHPEMRRRFERFAILVAFEEGDDWIEVFRKNDDRQIGGVDGAPFFWKPELSVFGRFLRVAVSGAGFLHLDQVEVFGPGEVPAAVVGR